MPLKPFLTPQFTSLDYQCRTLRTPANKEWLGVFNSALLEMTNPYNWEQVETGDLTIEEAIEIVEAVLIEFFATEVCTENGDCLQPNGSRVLSLDLDGNIRQLSNGAWVTPTDNYTIPPVPEREEPTEIERRCAAAANAENVLRQVYEVAADAIAGDLDAAEVIAAMAAYFVAAIGLWLGLAFAALAFAALALFRAFIEIAEFMTIDLWDAAFSELLICVLFECAIDDDDVVTFDFTCVNEQMAAAVNLGGVDALNQLRLFGQVSFILNVIGADGLNAAGATTEIDDADCSNCDEEWCICFDFTSPNGLQGWTIGNGFQDAGGLSDPTSSFDALTVTSPTFSAPTFVHQIEIWLNEDWSGTSPRVVVANDATFTMPWLADGTGNLPDHFYVVIDAEIDTFAINMDRYVGAVERFGAMRVTQICVMGIGSNPLGEDNCEY